jgi:hypothetical protein
MQSLSDVAALKILNQTAGLLSGEDQANDWLKVVTGANGYVTFRPTLPGDTTTYGIANGSLGQPVSATGVSGDYLERVILSVSNPSNSRTFLQDGNVYNYTSAGTGTAFTNTTTVNFGMGSTALTATQALPLVNQFLIATYTVLGFQVLLARRILAATATAGSSPNLYTTLTIDSATVAGAAATAMVTTAGAAFISPLLEILPTGAQGSDSLQLTMRSVNGGWRVFTDSGVSVVLVGRFS